jgi:hypothetical protein
VLDVAQTGRWERKTVYKPVSLTVDAHEALKKAQISFAAAAGRRLSLSETLQASLNVTARHLDDFVEEVHQE